MEIEEAMSRLSVGTVWELCSPFLKGGNSAFITAIASDLFQKTNLAHSNHYGPNCSNRK